MNNRYRIVYYIPSQKHGSSYAVAALMERPEGLRLIVAVRIPCSCSFDKHVDHRPLINELLAKLAKDLPKKITESIVISSKLQFGEIKRYPVRVKDPVHWLRRFILPH